MKMYKQFLTEILVEIISDPLVQRDLKVALDAGDSDKVVDIYKSYMNTIGKHKDAKFKKEVDKKGNLYIGKHTKHPTFLLPTVDILPKSKRKTM